MSGHQASTNQPLEEFERWSTCFEMRDTGLRCRLPLLSVLKATSEDVMTLAVPETLKIQRGIEKGILSLLGGASRSCSIMDILLLIATHSIIARSGILQTLSPAFWVRRCGEPRPALPVGQLSALSGEDERVVRVALAPMIADKAVDMVESSGGVSAVVLRDGVIDISSFRRHLKF